jgi:hypothetical protein
VPAEYGSLLRGVDLLATEHRIDPRAQPALLREADEQRGGLVSDSVLGVVEVQAWSLCCQTFTASRILREQLTEMHRANAVMVLFECFPGR